MDNYPFDNQQPTPDPALPQNHHHGSGVGNAAVHHAQQSDTHYHGHEEYGFSPGPIPMAPQPVVQVLSPRGVEYVFLTIALLTGGLSLIGILILLVNGNTDFGALAFPTAALLIALPVFAWLFLHLKQAELKDPQLSFDPSKRRSTQFTKIIAFATCFFTLIGFVYAIFAKAGGNYKGSLVRLFLDVLVILVVAGGILAYYWIDEYRA
jgi:hypothetical protein